MKAVTAFVIVVVALFSRAAPAGFSVDENTGEPHYTYNIPLPAARGRYQPALTLTYGSSNQTDYGYGFGWALLGDWIETTQSPTGAFRTVYVHNGVRRPLLPGRGGSVAEVDDNETHLTFTRLACSDSIASDVAGNQYRFLRVSGGPCTGIQYLQGVTDLDGNFASFQWVFEPQYFPTIVSQPPALAPDHYLTSITYNTYNPGASPTPYATSIDLEYFAQDGVGSTPGNLQLNVIRIKNQGNTVRRYGLAYNYKGNPYGTSPGTLRVLTGITECGKDTGKCNGPTTFDYFQTSGSLIFPFTPIVTPSGAQYTISYAANPDYDGRVQNAVQSVTLSGPGLETNQRKYFYDTWVPATTNWFDQSKEVIGYTHSYVLDTSTNTVRMTTWETASHTFRGVPAQVEWGPASNPAATPPQYTVYQRSIAEHTSLSLNGTCIPPSPPVSQGVAGIAQDYAGSGGPSAFYPAIPFTSRVRQASYLGATEFASETTAACNKVDSYGNVLQTHVDPDVSRSGDDVYENVAFVFSTTPTPCVNCVATETVTADALQTNLLASTRYSYDATWHIATVWKTTVPSIETRLATYLYNTNGTLASKVEGPDDEAISTSYTYDAPYQLRPVRIATSQAGKTLTTDTIYDVYGRTTLVSGPYLGSPATGPSVAAAYDDLDRPISLARQPISGSTVIDGTAAFTYTNATAATPGAITSYAFAVPLTYSGATPPQTSDARQTITYFDGLGRAIQRRERMGGASSGNSSANIVQNLSNFRVTALVYDGGGRLRAELEPFYSASGSFRDYRTATLDDVVPTNNGGLSTALHARLHTYDPQGREVCSAYAYVPSGGAVPAPPATCQSNFAEASAYMRATATCYRAATEKVPAMLAVKVMAPELTAKGAPDCSGNPLGPESFSDPSGAVYESRDIDGNGMQYTYDLNRNMTGIVRSASDNGAVVAVSLAYDMLGRVTHRTDPDIGTYDYSYFAGGRLKKVTLAAHALGGGLSANDYVDFTYDMGRIAKRQPCVAQASSGAVIWNCTPDAFVYDSPYLGGSYAYVAGRLAYAQNANATVAFGYTPEGGVTVRDQTVAGLSGVFSATSSVLLNGQPTSVSFASGYGATLAATTSYDSMWRPVQLSSGVTTFWTANAGSVGAYDISDRIASASLDNSSVQSTWTYASFSGLESGAQVLAPNRVLYSVNSETYRGSRLASLNDATTGTTYSYSYTDGGRLKAARAVTGNNVNSLLCFSFNRNKLYTPGASLGNLERVREQASSLPAVETYNYSGTDVAVSGAGPDAAVSISTQAQTTNLISYDYVGRVVSKNNGAEHFTYDVLGRLTSVTRANDIGEVLSYDPMGQIVGRLSGSALTYYVGGAATVTTPKPASCTAPGCVLDSGASVTVDVHMHVANRRIASVRALPNGMGRVLYYQRGRLGSVVATSTDGAGTGALYRYDAYGNLTFAQGDSGDQASELGFAGRLRLSNGLHVMGNRIYDVRLRQFLQPDALNPMSYTYAAGDPINLVDPTGRRARAYEPRTRENDPTIDHTHGGTDGGWGIIPWVTPGDLAHAADIAWDGIKKAADFVIHCFGFCSGGGDSPPPPPPPPRYATPNGPQRGAPSGSPEQPDVEVEDQSPLPGTMAIPNDVNINMNIINASIHRGDYLWFYRQVRNRGPWDYKQRGRQFQDFGNFNYGATGLAIGVSPQLLLRMAGWAQRQAGTSRFEWGNPFLNPGTRFTAPTFSDPPFGDDPVDQAFIRLGFMYFDFFEAQLDGW